MPVPAQQRLGPRWQAGSADAIYQSLNLIAHDRPDLVLVFGADHVYRMDPRPMIDQHLAWGAGVTVAAIGVPVGQAAGFGVARAAPDGHRIEAFVEKPAAPGRLARPGAPGEALASMGNYVFDTDVLVDAVRADAADAGSGHSIGGDIIPMLVREQAAHVYDFARNTVPGADPGEESYWREVGTLDGYFAAHMDLCAPHPALNLNNDEWPILTHIPPHPPAKFVRDDDGRAGTALDSLVCNGAIVRGGYLRSSVLSPEVLVASGSRVERAVLLHRCHIGRHAVVQDAILDKNVVVAEGATIGVDKKRDRARGFVVSAGGVTVVAKGQVVKP
jgi:glucose-1-phosphate adenylyltransferase